MFALNVELYRLTLHSRNTRLTGLRNFLILAHGPQLGGASVFLQRNYFSKVV